MTEKGRKPKFLLKGKVLSIEKDRICVELTDPESEKLYEAWRKMPNRRSLEFDCSPIIFNYEACEIDPNA